MKAAILILTLAMATACSVEKRMDDMDNKMGDVQKAAKEMNQSLNATQQDTAAMVAYAKQAVEVFQVLIQSAAKASEGLSDIPAPGPDFNHGQAAIPSPAPAPVPRPVIVSGVDLSGKSVAELTSLRNELKHAIQVKGLLKHTIPNILAFVRTVKIKLPDSSMDPSKAALITEISSLLLQL